MSPQTLVRVLFAFALMLGVPAVADAMECSSGMTASIDPVPPKRQVSLERHFKILDNFPATADAVIVGDSMAERWPDKLLQSLFGTREVLNLGVRSDRTQNILWRLNSLPLSLIHPRSVVLFAGTNNLSDGDTPCDIAQGLNAISSVLKQAWPDASLYVMPVLPRGANFDFRFADRMTLNEIISTRRGGYTVLHVNEPLIEGDCATVARCTNFRDDRVHLTARGYQTLTDSLDGAIKGSTK